MIEIGRTSGNARADVSMFQSFDMSESNVWHMAQSANRIDQNLGVWVAVAAYAKAQHVATHRQNIILSKI